MNKMETSIIESVNNQMFIKNVNFNPNVYNEVPIFKNLLIQNFYDQEGFHGYLNKFSQAWESILNDSFKKLIKMYNQKYMAKQLKEQEKQQTLLSMAAEYDAENLSLDYFDITPSIISITNSMRTSGISKKKPTRKKRA
jgi:hypothetical protein